MSVRSRISLDFFIRGIYGVEKWVGLELAHLSKELQLRVLKDKLFIKVDQYYAHYIYKRFLLFGFFASFSFGSYQKDRTHATDAGERGGTGGMMGACMSLHISTTVPLPPMIPTA